MQISLIRLCRTLFAGVVLAAIAGCSGGDNADIGRDGVGNPGQVPLANLEAVPFPGDLDDEPGIRHTSATADFPRDGEDSWRSISTPAAALTKMARELTSMPGTLKGTGSLMRSKQYLPPSIHMSRVASTHQPSASPTRMTD